MDGPNTVEIMAIVSGPVRRSYGPSLTHLELRYVDGPSTAEIVAIVSGPVRGS